jgi:hypothetical protein
MQLKNTCLGFRDELTATNIPRVTSRRLASYRKHYRARNEDSRVQSSLKNGNALCFCPVQIHALIFIATTF